ncbi:uncharacterized protein FA14DRAFT_159478 [Meira miltonrushii]|uniref:UDP-N-acetylglucosamine transferase subunit ALG13 n=1 Tax=Meira miltonrushii TaxID=1280837 RepID=A0A316VIS6_9BASI|nr:uncharacterized protein FA14DRAFT_159478 [Meira miltonrushii]PWN37410.1 hypothetical protein FA14DRAFT_159478 [Meira miltonrushii]
MTTTNTNNAPTIFVTVGSTKFTALVAAMLSCKVVDAIADACKHTTSSPRLIIQYGATPLSDILLESGSVLHRTSKGKGKKFDDPLGASGTLPIPMSAFLPKNDQNATPDLVMQDNLLAKSFRLGQTSKLDHPDEDEEDDQLRTKRKHFTFTVQAGTSDGESEVHIELRDYVPDLRPFLLSSDVVISHAGSGTILEALRLPAEQKSKLVVVPNETLMDNHQAELAQALAQQNYLVATRVRGKMGEENRLPSLLQALLSPNASNAPRTTPFPPFIPGRFQTLIDAEMGFL